jgi:polynucleotide 5'-kinase involved in rRNA processing
MQIPRAWAPLANSLMPIAAADGNAQRPMDVEAESAHPPAEASSTPARRVVITGRKGMGKSTISQYLLNSLLNRYLAHTHHTAHGTQRTHSPRVRLLCVRYPHVVFLDTDLGQPEFTPAGLVSLHVISSPVFGPSFMHLASPLKCVSSPA